jgi:phytoene/squalene synthetase
MTIEFFKENSYQISELITKKYSTSFSLATSLLEKDMRKAIYAVYGFVRLADEIVDTFHGYNKDYLLNKLDEDLKYALEYNISTNTVLVAFADTVKKYDINEAHIRAFMDSMKYDLAKSNYTTQDDINKYIFGSAEVVGLICLKIFCNGQQTLYDRLEAPAQRLGSAFQKVNFLRDLKMDINVLGRIYYPEIANSDFNENSKHIIEKSIEYDFKGALKGIRQLPGKSKLAVSLAYFYYISLFEKIKKASPQKILSERIRISNFKKYLIIVKVVLMYRLKLI